MHHCCENGSVVARVHASSKGSEVVVFRQGLISRKFCIAVLVAAFLCSLKKIAVISVPVSKFCCNALIELCGRIFDCEAASKSWIDKFQVCAVVL